MINGQMSKKEEPKTCVIYVRISDFGSVEETLSPDVQIQLAKKEVRERKMVLLEEPYSDLGKSGTSLNRPRLQDMLARCLEGDVDAIVVQDTSRLCRNTGDYIAIKAMLQKEGIVIISPNQPSASKDDPYSNYIDEIIAASNSLQPRITSFKVKLVMKQKFEFGWWPSMAPLGYKNEINKTPTCQFDRKIIIPNEETAPLIKLAFKKYATGNYSMLKLSKILHKKGLVTKLGRPIAHSTLQQILSNPFYYGLMERGGVKLMGKHQPLVSKKLLDICKLIARRHANFVVRERKHDFLLRGLLYCGCGQRHTAEWHNINSKKRERIAYYHCAKRKPCTSRYIEAGEMEKQVEDCLKSIKFTKGFTSKLAIEVMRYLKKLDKERNKESKSLTNKKNALLVKKDILEKNFLEENISPESFNSMQAKMEREINEINTNFGKLEKTHTIDFDLFKEVLKLSRNIPKTYTETPDNIKKSYLTFFFQKIVVEDKKIKKIIHSPLINELILQEKVILSDNWLPKQELNQVVL